MERVVRGRLRSHDARCRSAARVRAVRAAGAAAVRALRGDRRLERPVDVVAEARVLRDVLRHVLERRAVARHGIDAVDPSVVPVVDERLPARILRGGRGRRGESPLRRPRARAALSGGCVSRELASEWDQCRPYVDWSLRKCPPKARRELMSVSTMAMTAGLIQPFAFCKGVPARASATVARCERPRGSSSSASQARCWRWRSSSGRARATGACSGSASGPRWLHSCSLFATLLGFLPRPAPTKRGWWALGLFAAFVLWGGLTIAWSIAPDRSWAYLNRGLAYLAFVVLGLFVAALVRRPATWTAGLLAALCLGVLGWALLGKVFPGLFPDGARVARLRNPIGYWNALALVAALALPLGLWLAAGRGTRASCARRASSSSTSPASLSCSRTRGRASSSPRRASCLWLVAVHGIGSRAWRCSLPRACPRSSSSRGRRRSRASSTISRRRPRASGPAHGSRSRSCSASRPRSASRTTPPSAGERLSADARRRWALRLGGALAAVAVGVVVAATVAIGGPGEWLDEFRGKGDVVQGSGRLGELSSNNRWTWWGESWDLFRDAPAGGHGAHTFEIARRPIRVGSVVTAEPHNVALQALAETGLAGLLLGLAAAGFRAARLRGSAAPARRRRARGGGCAGSCSFPSISFMRSPTSTGTSWRRRRRCSSRWACCCGRAGRRSCNAEPPRSRGRRRAWPGSASSTR